MQSGLSLVLLALRKSRGANLASAFGAFADRGAAGGFEEAGGVEEADVGEGLGEVAGEAAGLGVVALGEEADVVADGEEALEEAAGVLVAAEEGEAVDEPE